MADAADARTIFMPREKGDSGPIRFGVWFAGFSTCSFLFVIEFDLAL